MKVCEIARQVGGRVVGDSNLDLLGFSPAYAAKKGDLTFAENETYFRLAEQTAASAILVDTLYSGGVKTLIHVPNSRIAFAKILPLFFPEPEFKPGIHATVVVAPSASIDASAFIGPFCTIGEEVKIGPNSIVETGCYVGDHCSLGAHTHLFPRVTLSPGTLVGNRVRIHAGAVLGSDGFGYVLDGGAHRKVPQVGHVLVHDDVEIGANTTVDRGALGPTVIGRGTKIDNLVQLGHNVVTGDHCILVSQVGVAGSTKLGSYVTVAGQAGIAGHLKIGNRVIISAQSGVMSHVPDGEKWFGSPAAPDRQMKRQMLAAQQLPELLRRVAELEKELLGRKKSEGTQPAFSDQGSVSENTPSQP